MTLFRRTVFDRTGRFTKGDGMNQVIRKTRACTLETLDKDLRDAIRTHGANYGLRDLEENILMCCETISAHPKKGFFGGVTTTLSAVYVTPKWLVWADGNNQKDGTAGTAQLKHIEVRDYKTTASYSVTPDQGLNVTGRYTNKNRTGITFIMLDCEPDGLRFRKVLEEAMNVSQRSNK